MATNKDEPKLVVVPVRLEPRVKLQLERLARRDKRKFGQFVRIILGEYVESELARARKTA